MKPSILPLAAGLLIGLGSLSLHSTAQAAAMVPANTDFQAEGFVNILVGGIGYACTATFFGHIDSSGAASIHGEKTIFQGTTGACGITLGVGEWTLTPTSATTAALRNIEFGLPGYFNCTGDVSGELIDGVYNFYGELEADNGNICRFSGLPNTSPSIGISWP